MRHFRHAAVHLALIAMMLRALLPVGWMPNPTGTGDGAFIICTMDGPVQSMDPHHAPGKKTPVDGRSHEECPFAAAAHVAAPATVAHLASPSVAGHFFGPPAAAIAVARVAEHQPQSPRAPPQAV